MSGIKSIGKQKPTDHVPFHLPQDAVSLGKHERDCCRARVMNLLIVVRVFLWVDRFPKLLPLPIAEQLGGDLSKGHPQGSQRRLIVLPLPAQLCSLLVLCSCFLCQQALRSNRKLQQGYLSRHTSFKISLPYALAHATALHVADCESPQTTLLC